MAPDANSEAAESQGSATPFPERSDTTDDTIGFYEKGVADADQAMAPPGTEPGEVWEDDEVLRAPPSGPASSEARLTFKSVEALKDIIAELSQDMMGDQGGGEAYLRARVAATPGEQEECPEVLGESEIHGDLPAKQSGAAMTAPLPERLHPKPHTRLAEAEQLLQELEQQPYEPGEVPERTGTARAPVAPGDTRTPAVPSLPTDGADVAGAHGFQPGSKSESGSGTASSRPRPSSRRGWAVFRWMLVLLAAGLMCAAGYLVYAYVARPAARTPPEILYERAREYMNRGRYQEAADTFLLFAQSFPDHAKASEAQFQAAFALQVLSTRQPKDSYALKERSLALFVQFLKDNPGDPKGPLAETLVDTLHVELGHYEDAAAVLRDLLHQVDEPAIALPILRTLGRAYRAQGNYEEAESAYLRAAALPGNDSVFADYTDLGDLYRERARGSRDENEKLQFNAAAIAYWAKAMETPGIDLITSAEIRRQLPGFEAGTGRDRAEAVTEMGPAAPPP